MNDAHDPGGKVKLAVPDGIYSHAIFSKCGRYRYYLNRRWNLEQPDKTVLFLMMNPSTATADVDDPTVKKCRSYANRWGYNRLIVANVMAYRATNPKDLLTIDDPVGPENHQSMVQMLYGWKPFVVCAWGRIPKKLAYAENRAMDLIKGFDPHVLKLNISGRPYHPLYLANDVEPTPWLF